MNTEKLIASIIKKGKQEGLDAFKKAFVWLKNQFPKQKFNIVEREGNTTWTTTIYANNKLVMQYEESNDEEDRCFIYNQITFQEEVSKELTGNSTRENDIIEALKQAIEESPKRTSKWTKQAQSQNRWTLIPSEYPEKNETDTAKDNVDKNLRVPHWDQTSIFLEPDDESKDECSPEFDPIMDDPASNELRKDYGRFRNMHKIISEITENPRKLVWLKFKNFALSNGYKDKVAGDEAFVKNRNNAQSPMIKLIGAKNGKVLVFETGKGRYYI